MHCSIVAMGTGTGIRARIQGNCKITTAGTAAAAASATELNIKSSIVLSVFSSDFAGSISRVSRWHLVYGWLGDAPVAVLNQPAGGDGGAMGNGMH